MRKLTIKRNKAFAGCFGKSKIYIEDYENSNLTINKIPCRKLGILKNGEEKTFEIDSVSRRVYVIGDKISRNTCNDYYKIPVGDEDITLTGEHKYNPFNGNVFRFDGVTDEEILAHRKKTNKKATIIYCIVLAIVFAVSFAVPFLLDSAGVPETFTYGEMSITLTDDFSEKSYEGYSACYESYNAIVMVTKDYSSYFEDFETYTLKQYAEDTIAYNDFDDSVTLKEEDSLTYFEYEYTDEETGDIYSYFVPMYKSNDAFWFFQFSSYKEDYESYREQFIEWAKSVEFSEEKSDDVSIV